MKSQKQLMDSVVKWWDAGMVGNLILYRSPGAQTGDAIIERVIKVREMEPHVAAAFEMFMDELDIERGEVFRNSKGEPDRIKLTRRFDG
jgi:hypothetical protein